MTSQIQYCAELSLEGRASLFAALAKVLQGHAPKDELERLAAAIADGRPVEVRVVLDKSGITVVLCKNT